MTGKHADVTMIDYVEHDKVNQLECSVDEHNVQEFRYDESGNRIRKNKTYPTERQADLAQKSTQLEWNLRSRRFASLTRTPNPL